MNTPYEQLFDLVRSQRRKKRQKTAVDFLLSLYEGRRVCLSTLRAFPKEQRQWFLSVMEDYLKDTPAWIKQHRASLYALQQGYNETTVTLRLRKPPRRVRYSQQERERHQMPGL